MTDRKKPTARFWITVALVVVLLAYLLSFGPACWLGHRKAISAQAIKTVYGPIVGLLHNGPLPVRRAIAWYGGFSGKITQLEFDLIDSPFSVIAD